MWVEWVFRRCSNIRQTLCLKHADIFTTRKDTWTPLLELSALASDLEMLNLILDASDSATNRSSVLEVMSLSQQNHIICKKAELQSWCLLAPSEKTNKALIPVTTTRWLIVTAPVPHSPTVPPQIIPGDTVISFLQDYTAHIGWIGKLPWPP